MPKFWEDYKEGERFTTPGRTIGEDTINILAGIAGFTFPIFWDEEEARKSVFKSRIAPGALIILYMTGLEELSGFWDPETVIALVGLDKVRIRVPVRAGDTIRFEGEVTEQREIKDPGKGIIIHRSICKNQKGEIVAEAEAVHLVKKRLHNKI